jgi:hypothetical protein
VLTTTLMTGAIMHDVSQDSILRELMPDNIGNSDWFGVMFDTYDDHSNGYEFILLTSGGVQQARCSVYRRANGEG